MTTALEQQWERIVRMLKLRPAPGGGFISNIDPGETYYRDLNPRVSVSVGEGGMLAALAAGREVYEIGTGLGISTRYLARSARHLVSYDNDPWVREHVWPTLADLPQIELVDHEPDRSGWADMVFVDGNHNEAALRLDIEHAVRIIHPGGMIVFHDLVNWQVRKAIAAADLGPLFERSTEHGLGVVWPWTG